MLCMEAGCKVEFTAEEPPIQPATIPSPLQNGRTPQPNEHPSASASDEDGVQVVLTLDDVKLVDPPAAAPAPPVATNEAKKAR